MDQVLGSTPLGDAVTSVCQKRKTTNRFGNVFIAAIGWNRTIGVCHRCTCLSKGGPSGGGIERQGTTPPVAWTSFGPSRSADLIGHPSPLFAFSPEIQVVCQRGSLTTGFSVK